MHEKVQITMFNMWNNFNVTKVSEIAIFSNNDWGEEYYLSNNKKINTPTIGTKFSPEDYIKLIENCEEFMQVEIKKEESEGKKLSPFEQAIVDAYEADVPQTTKEVHVSFVEKKEND